MPDDFTPTWQWRFNPYEALRTRTVLLALVITAVALVLLSNFGFTLTSLLLLAAFTYSLRLALFVTSYRIVRTGVERENLKRTQLFRAELIRRVVPVAGGVFISRYSRPSRLDRFQGWLLPLPRGQRDAIVEHLQAICTGNSREDA